MSPLLLQSVAHPSITLNPPPPPPPKPSNSSLVVINPAFHLCDPGSTLSPKVVHGLSFSQSQSDYEGFSLGTPVFLPRQNRLSVNYILLWADTLDRDNLWNPPFSLNRMNKVMVLLLYLTAHSGPVKV